MKIGYLCSDVDVQVLGHHGCSVHIREFTNALVDAGHDVFLLANWLGGNGDVTPKARVYDLPPQGLNGPVWQALTDDPAIWRHSLDRDLGSILWNTRLQSQGAEIIARERPDFLYERYSLFGFGGLELSRRFEIPLILELNAPLCDQQEGFVRFPLIQTARQLEPQIITSADAIVALTQWLADWAIGLGANPDKIRVLPDAVSQPLFGGEASGAAPRARWNLGTDQVVGFLGSFHKWHDVSGLIDAFVGLHAADSSRRLLLVGDGHDREKLEKKVRQLHLEQAVVFTGKIPHEDVPDYLAAMDVAVVPYQPINDFFFSPMKLFESMAVGRPTVAAALGQIAEVVRHGETGWLYPAGDNARLQHAIESLLADPPRAARIGQAAREYVLSHHTWSHVVEQVVQMAQQLRS